MTAIRDKWLAFNRRHRIGTLKFDLATAQAPDYQDVIDVLKPATATSLAILAGYGLGGGIGATTALGLAVSYALLDLKRHFTGWMFSALSDATSIPAESVKTEIDQLFEEDKTIWWGEALQAALEANNIPAKVVAKDTSGASLDLYELEVKKGFDINKLQSLGGNFARDMGLPAGTVITVDPNIGEGRSGLFIPKINRKTIVLKSFLTKIPESLRLPCVVGVDYLGRDLIIDLTKSKHLLVAGETGGGKSIQISNMILSLCHTLSPQRLKMTMIDPKMVELALYESLPHLTEPPITDMDRAAIALRALELDMRQRYERLKSRKLRDIETFNATYPDEAIPYHVVLVDEVADLVDIKKPLDEEDKTSIGAIAEQCLTNIARMGRACGMYLMLGAQRFDSETFRGQLRSNIPSAIGMKVKAYNQSLVIIGTRGCEYLLGAGDCYVALTGASTPLRAQAAFASDKEVEALVSLIGKKWEVSCNPLLSPAA